MTDAPAILTQLQTQLAACAAWSSGSGAIHYPDHDLTTVSTWPVAILAESSRTSTVFAAGAAGLASGVLEITIHSTASIGTVESLARTLVTQLHSAQSGIPFRTGEAGLSSEPSDAAEAGGTAYCSVTITLPWGLEP